MRSVMAWTTTAMAKLMKTIQIWAKAASPVLVSVEGLGLWSVMQIATAPCVTPKLEAQRKSFATGWTTIAMGIPTKIGRTRAKSA
ncbi:MAG: hypothetical protein BWX66_01696 [Deltaproteobacteria bacterium ADurb.Bin058]|nr:MAG: hypothetical protein BWX66_01696 [Deltaproteobacteria bacterium ADurb.Bin058]